MLVGVFVLGYLAVALEHKIEINKSATVLVMAVISWVLVVMRADAFGGTQAVVEQLAHHLQDTAQIIIFLMGAMTIVAGIQAHNGFRVVTDFLRAKKPGVLLWAVSFITFFLSAVLDNLTTAIVMTSMLPRLFATRQERVVAASMIIIAANAGGAWTPIGDVTTTMLWIGGRITALNIMKMLFIPSVVSLLVPLAYFSYVMRRSRIAVPAGSEQPVIMPVVSAAGGAPSSRFIFFLGVGALIFVPVFRALTNLPPFMGMMAGLGVFWLVTDLRYRDDHTLRIPHILSKIDFVSILFFLGILLTVAALDTAGLLHGLANWLDQSVRNKDVIGTLLGLLSSIVDNVPLTAASMGMYPLQAYPADHKLWELLAYAVGTGGSILIIGSAAGVVVMGMEKITFTWYLRKVSVPALLGYAAGIAAYLAQYACIH